jgi:2',3'-cyclic-nucleotide 2'-phosphodiesterase (5'-nucleotidase family)
MLLNYGQMFTILPFGNATVVGEMTGAQIQDVLNQAATLGKGVIQTSGLHYKFYSYSDANPGPQPYAWGSYDACVINPVTEACEPLEANRVYKVGTNEFLAPAGGDNFSGFKYMKNITYWGDMLNAVNDWVANNYTLAAPYKGPKGDGALDGRITQETDIVPVTILHHNDSHGRLLKSGSYQGLTQLATIVNQERAHNPNRTLLFSLGDNIQGDSMMYYFKNAAEGTTADGTVLPPNLQTNPFIKAMNAMGYNGMVLGNHEFNFGSAVFDSTFSQASFPLLGANVADSGSYGINKVGLSDLASANVEGVKVNVYDGYEYMLPSGDPDDPDITVGVLGLTNHRVPNYELPSNIPGLTFSDPIQTATDLVPVLDANSDAVVALTHIGFTEDPKSVEVDANVDTNLAKTVSGIDMIIGGHSHTNPSTGFGDYKYLPALVGNPDNQSVIINQAYRYNQYLGEMVLGFKYDAVNGYTLVSTAGRYIAISSSTVEDPIIKAIVDPYQAILNSYNNTTIGETLAPIDALNAFTQETNGANLQADASMWELQSHGITVDFHLSGAMTNKKIADTATPTTPYTLKISDMFTAMPYENSLVVLKMTGPELKAVLERGYRNYYYYKYVSGYGGYSYYTTCMLDTSDNARVYYKDTNPQLPNGNNVFGLQVNGKFIDFTDPTTTYNVSTVNYLAAGSCNFNNGGVTLWPLDSIVADTQYYVRDAVINYVMDQETINPQIEGRLVFNGFLNLFLPFIIK